MTNPEFCSAVWRKSSHSGNGGGQCVEIATIAGAVAIRDSKNTHGPTLSIARRHFRGLVQRMKSDVLDLSAQP